MTSTEYFTNTYIEMDEQGYYVSGRITYTMPDLGRPLIDAESVEDFEAMDIKSAKSNVHLDIDDFCQSELLDRVVDSMNKEW